MNEEKEIWSFSRLSSYDNCPYSYYANYRLQEEDGGNGWSDLGSLSHDILEMVAKKELDFNDAADYFFYNLPDIQFPTMKPNYKQKLINDCLGFFEKLPTLQKELEFEKVIGVERDFVVDIGGEKIRGFIDAEYRLDDGILNRDWKTSSMSGFSGKKLKEKARQIYIYSLATKEHFGEFPKYLEFYMIKYQKKVRIEFNMKDYQEAIGWALGVIERIQNDTTWEKKNDYFFCKNLCSSTSCEFSGNYKQK